MRPYGICLCPSGLFHLAQCSPVPSMLLQRGGASFFGLNVEGGVGRAGESSRGGMGTTVIEHQ